MYLGTKEEMRKKGEQGSQKIPGLLPSHPWHFSPYRKSMLTNFNEKVSVLLGFKLYRAHESRQADEKSPPSHKSQKSQLFPQSKGSFKNR